MRTELMVGRSTEMDDKDFVGMTCDQMDQWQLDQTMPGEGSYEPTDAERLGQCDAITGEFCCWLQPEQREGNTHRWPWLMPRGEYEEKFG